MERKVTAPAQACFELERETAVKTEARSVSADALWGAKRGRGIAAIYIAWVTAVRVFAGEGPFERDGTSVSAVVGFYAITGLVSDAIRGWPARWDLLDAVAIPIFALYLGLLFGRTIAKAGRPARSPATKARCVSRKRSGSSLPTRRRFFADEAQGCARGIEHLAIREMHRV